MHIFATSEKVWSWNSHEGNLRTVCTTANRFNDRRNAQIFHDFLSQVDWCHVFLDDLFHVVVLVFKGQENTFGTKFLVHLACDVFHHGFTGFKVLSLEVSDNVASMRLLNSPIDIHQMEKALVAICFFRAVFFRELIVEVNG